MDVFNAVIVQIRSDLLGLHLATAFSVAGHDSFCFLLPQKVADLWSLDSTRTIHFMFNKVPSP